MGLRSRLAAQPRTFPERRPPARRVSRFSGYAPDRRSAPRCCHRSRGSVRMLRQVGGREDGTEEQCLSQEFMNRSGNQNDSLRSEERLEWKRFVGYGGNRPQRRRKVETQPAAAAGPAPTRAIQELNDKTKNSV